MLELLLVLLRARTNAIGTHWISDSGRTLSHLVVNTPDRSCADRELKAWLLPEELQQDSIRVKRAGKTRMILQEMRSVKEALAIQTKRGYWYNREQTGARHREQTT